MLPLLDTPLWAVHISDGVLNWPWWVGGFVLLLPLFLVGAWRLHEDDIPKVALLTAAFFVASSIHVRLTPFTTVHLLLNGLVGVVLGRRAALAIPIGLSFQYAFTGHGGLTTLGVNSCVILLPALLAGTVFAWLRRVPWVRRPWFRSGLVAASALVWVLGLVYGVTFLVGSTREESIVESLTRANEIALSPITLALAGVVAGLAAWGERRLENAPEFPLGLAIGEGAVLATVVLQMVVLLAGGDPGKVAPEGWRFLVLCSIVPHLPLAVLEGTILGFTVGFLARVKPEMLGWLPPEKTTCPVDSLP